MPLLEGIISDSCFDEQLRCQPFKMLATVEEGRNMADTIQNGFPSDAAFQMSDLAGTSFSLNGIRTLLMELSNLQYVHDESRFGAA